LALRDHAWPSTKQHCAGDCDQGWRVSAAVLKITKHQLLRADAILEKSITMIVEVMKNAPLLH